VTFPGFVAIVGGGSVAVSGVALALVPRSGSGRSRVLWWVTGIVVATTLTVGAAVLAAHTDGFDDLLLIGLGFYAALIALLLGHTKARDVPAWWLGNAAVALAWAVLFVVVLASSVAPPEAP